MESLYVCHFSNGHIKVGRSIKPHARCASHAERVSCVGIEMLAHHIVPCAEDVGRREALLIERCAENAAKRHKNEWFVGLEYEAACAWANYFAVLEFPPIPAPPVREVVAYAPYVLLGYESRWDGAKHYWRPLYPHLPPMPSAGVCRWDLRKGDWHLIWPELISHPCSYLFAPMHPHRDGAPSFRDWVKAWPVGFDSRGWIESMPDSAKRIVAEVLAESADSGIEHMNEGVAGVVHAANSLAPH